MASLFVFLALAWAATAPISKPLLWYLVAQAAYLAVVWPAYYYYGNDAWEFMLIYAVMTGVCLIPTVLIGLFALPHHEAPITMIFVPPSVSLIILALASYGIHRPSTGMYIQIAEAAVLVACGTLVGFCAPFYNSKAARTTALTLSVLWLLLAAFRYCYVMHVGIPAWETANGIIPPGLMTLACLWLGIRLRGDEQQTIVVPVH